MKPTGKVGIASIRYAPGHMSLPGGTSTNHLKMLLSQEKGNGRV